MQLPTCRLLVAITHTLEGMLRFPLPLFDRPGNGISLGAFEESLSFPVVWESWDCVLVPVGGI